MMKHWLATCLATTTLLLASVAFGAFHLFSIEQVYSNADGTIQFVVVTSSINGENFWSQGGRLSSTDMGGGTRSMAFTTDLPNSNTAGKRVLIATQGFADLGIVTPDYIIPNNFIATGPGSVTYVASTLNYPAGLPHDGVSALNIAGAVIPNVATNFAGQTGSVQPLASISPQPGNWSNPNEQGTGFSFDFKHGVLVVVFFSFQATGAPQWYIASGPVSGANWTGKLAKFVNGQCILSSCPYVFPTTAGDDGDVSIVFSSNTAGMMTLPGGRVIPITPTAF